MKEIEIYREFATKLVKIYDSDPDGFWEISMNHFLAYFTKPSLIFKRSKNVLALTSLLGSLEKDTEILIDLIDARWKTKIRGLKSARKQYIQDAFPVFAMLAIWAKEAGLQEILENYDQVFGDGKVQHEIFHRIRLMFLESEIREKQSRWVCSPYIEGKAIDLGIKGLNAVAPFILCLEKAGRVDQTDKYLKVFMLIGAVIQMVDDWEDLSNDLKIGHYSYITLGWREFDQKIDIVTSIKGDRQRVIKTYNECRNLLEKARVLLNELNDKIIMQLLYVTENRMEGYYKKEFSIQ